MKSLDEWLQLRSARNVPRSTCNFCFDFFSCHFPTAFNPWNPPFIRLRMRKTTEIHCSAVSTNCIRAHRAVQYSNWTFNTVCMRKSQCGPVAISTTINYIRQCQPYSTICRSFRTKWFRILPEWRAITSNSSSIFCAVTSTHTSIRLELFAPIQRKQLWCGTNWGEIWSHECGRVFLQQSLCP